jgi:hypothetical protein
VKNLNPLTLSVTVVVAVMPPLVPVMVILEVPFLAPEVLRVRIEEPVAGLLENDAVTPEGSPDAFRLTEPVNPSTGVIVIVEVVLPLDETVLEVGEALSVKVGAWTTRLTCCVASSAPLVPVTVS